MNLDLARLVPIAGDAGLVCRDAGAVLWVAARAPAALVGELVERFLRAEHATSLMDQLRGVVATNDHSRVPPFALVAGVDDGFTVFVFGPVQVRVEGPDGGETVLAGPRAVAGVERTVTTELTTVVASAVGGPGPLTIDAVVDVRAGIVAGDGFALTTADEPVRFDGDDGGGAVEAPLAEPEPEPVGQPVPEPIREGPGGETVTFAAIAPSPGEPEEVAPETVQGVLCGQGHLNDPRTQSCPLCGAPVVPGSPIVAGPRPSLGRLLFDDGTECTLVADRVIGRQPETSPLVQNGSARPLRLEDPERSISRAHAEIRLVGWDVHFRNLSTTNGSFLWDPTSGRWVPLGVDQPLVLQPGMHIALGRRPALFESATRR